MYQLIPHLSRTPAATPALAQSFAEMTPYWGERRRDPRRLRELDACLKSGRIIQFNWAVAHMDGVRYRVNGQHSSIALCTAGAGGYFPSNARVSIAEYHCETRDDVAVLWRSFDQKWSSRSSQDQVRAGTEEIAGSGRMKILISSAVALDLADGVKMSMTPDQRVSLLKESPSFCDMVLNVLRGREKGDLARVAVVAAMHRTWKCDPVRALEFWQLVETEAHPDNANASRVLAKLIRGEPSKAKDMSPDATKAMFVRCIHAWNNWGSGSGVTQLRYYSNADSTPIAKRPRQQNGTCT